MALKAMGKDDIMELKKFVNDVEALVSKMSLPRADHLTVIEGFTRLRKFLEENEDNKKEEEK